MTYFARFLAGLDIVLREVGTDTKLLGTRLEPFAPLAVTSVMAEEDLDHRTQIVRLPSDSSERLAGGVWCRLRYMQGFLPQMIGGR